jgi:nicotinamidase-related amidase
MLSRIDAVLIIIDIQGNLAQTMYDKENLFANTVKLIKGFKVFNLPIILTEQIPQKLGQTIPVISQELNGIVPIAKKTFSCWDDRNFTEQLEGLRRRHIVLTGIESHICVYQTALDLIQNRYNVYLATDAVSSRTPGNRQVGISAIKSAGAHLTSTEMVLFELLRTATDPKFKDIFKIVK